MKKNECVNQRWEKRTERKRLRRGMKRSLEEELETEGYKHFYVHNTGHWLGLDVHDVGEYQIDGHSRELEPGMVMTIEPGIYIGPDESSVRKCWRGVGIRIEDNIAITKKEPMLSGKHLMPWKKSLKQGSPL